MNPFKLGEAAGSVRETLSIIGSDLGREVSGLWREGRAMFRTAMGTNTAQGDLVTGAIFKATPASRDGYPALRAWIESPHKLMEDDRVVTFGFPAPGRGLDARGSNSGALDGVILPPGPVNTGGGRGMMGETRGIISKGPDGVRIERDAALSGSGHFYPGRTSFPDHIMLAGRPLREYVRDGQPVTGGLGTFSDMTLAAKGLRQPISDALVPADHITSAAHLHPAVAKLDDQERVNAVLGVRAYASKMASLWAPDMADTTELAGKLAEGMSASKVNMVTSAMRRANTVEEGEQAVRQMADAEHIRLVHTPLIYG